MCKDRHVLCKDCQNLLFHVWMKREERKSARILLIIIITRNQVTIYYISVIPKFLPWE